MEFADKRPVAVIDNAATRQEAEFPDIAFAGVVDRRANEDLRAPIGDIEAFAGVQGRVLVRDGAENVNAASSGLSG